MTYNIIYRHIFSSDSREISYKLAHISLHISILVDSHKTTLKFTDLGNIDDRDSASSAMRATRTFCG